MGRIVQFRQRRDRATLTLELRGNPSRSLALVKMANSSIPNAKTARGPGGDREGPSIFNWVEQRNTSAPQPCFSFAKGERIMRETAQLTAT